MKLYSMTATFGKLEHETLTLQPGLNVIHAPNEWGKSTWCAFLVAMLYGIETRVHTTKTALADKDRYAPWSGAPMAGRIDLNWNGRDITIERSSKGRNVFGIFRAYETASGLDVPELTATNCGQVLLGVEKSVFTRAGFLRLTDLPVTQDESLRRRLNALVTTGDESGTADTLAQKLKELKNRCRLNRSTGLLPQLEAQRGDLEGKLRELQELQEQSDRIKLRQAQLEHFHTQLENHQAALAYEANRAYGEKLAAARLAQNTAAQKARELEAQCAGLPASDEVDRKLLQLQQLRDSRDSLQMEAQLLPPAPVLPQAEAPFRDVDPETAVSQAKTCTQIYAQDTQKKPFPWYSILLLCLGLAAALIPHWGGKIAGAVLLVAGIILWAVYSSDRRRRQASVKALLDSYRPIAPENWVAAAEQYARDQRAYTEQLEKYRADREDLNRRARELEQQTQLLTQGQSLSQCCQACINAQELYKALGEARREQHRADELVQALQSSHKEAAPPLSPDTMTYSQQETTRLLSDCAYEQRQLHGKLGHCQGQMATLGSEVNLRQQLDRINDRITQLEDTYAALEIAQNTLAAASAQLQRRFAPRISRRAQELFNKLTQGRYDRLTLDDDLVVHAGAQNEDTLHSALWRSDGTIDQLYLALRLAVAEELTPQAPLVLDDALVRFDDKRLAEALELLEEEARHRQVILFTCQGREAAILNSK